MHHLERQRRRARTRTTSFFVCVTIQGLHKAFSIKKTKKIPFVQDTGNRHAHGGLVKPRFFDGIPIALFRGSRTRRLRPVGTCVLCVHDEREQRANNSIRTNSDTTTRTIIIVLLRRRKCSEPVQRPTRGSSPACAVAGLARQIQNGPRGAESHERSHLFRLTNAISVARRFPQTPFDTGARGRR